MPGFSQKVSLEIAVDNAEAVVAATRGGAQRLELCSSLADGGLTPGIGFVEWARRTTPVPLHCMVRPRGGNFVYTPAELAIMELEIAAMRRAHADGVVFGVLTSCSRIDIKAVRRLVAAARPMRVVFHRAFDLVADLAQALEDVIACGADILLTSGGAPTLEQGLPTVATLVERAAGRIEIMGGAGVRIANAGALWERSNVDTLHASLRSKWTAGRHTPAEGGATMGAHDGEDIYTVREEDVRAVLAMLTPRTETAVKRGTDEPLIAWVSDRS
jgi:copper homeostasis protein